ncbi:ShlB/FhaC/HecB family hemolysin secretion/activation protein [Myxosarcina sp. GI1]|uniref:ShlB/FhaC/HecB family hemolysin secretion/activation protein n=1 Tax=Myxosarcina sp. GI1 TaxID=1541065 RepID=UPI00155A2BB6|nr:ShlB/FhaC/HecB family hemolysin secretion/activation protein [Myxosarcina sp. GI1]
MRQNVKIAPERITISGNTVFSDSELIKKLEKFRGKKLSVYVLNDMAAEIENLYTSKGYRNSGAYIPQQEVSSSGSLKLQVIEGKIESIEIDGLENLNKSYVNSFFSSLRSKPLNVKTINEKLALLERSDAIENVSAELINGTQPGTDILLVSVEEAPVWKNSWNFNNWRSPIAGEYTATATSSYRSILGSEDELYGSYSLFEGADAFSIGYQIPVTSNRGTLSIEYQNNQSRIVDNILEDLGIRSESDMLSLGFNQPIANNFEREIALAISFERTESRTFIDGDFPYSFSEGSQDGRSAVSVLSLAGNWTERGQKSVWNFYSQLNFGLDAFDATVNDNAPDGIFFSWLGQSEWVRVLNRSENADLLFVTRLSGQLTPDDLLPVEQFVLGGVGTVRGYRQNQEVGDNALVANIELVVPLVGNNNSSSQIRLIPFVDFSRVWNVQGTNSAYLSSFGFGFRWQLREILSLRVDWGIPLVEVSDFDNSLQDSGISFSFQLQP